MDDVLSRLYNAFDAGKPADESEYVPTAKARGNELLAPHFLRRLRISKTPLNFLFSGHIGGGKSSELRHLANCLWKGHPTIGGQRYLPITVEILDYVDIYDVSPTDILLAIISEIGRFFREDSELRIELKDSLATRLIDRLKSSLPKGVEPSEAGLTVSGVSLKVKLLRQDPTRRQEVRKALDVDPSAFHEAANSLISEARIAAKQKGFADIVILIDSLDRIMRAKGITERQASHRNLFLDSALTFTELKVHKVLTVPLSLVRAHGPQLGQRYERRPFVLPLVKVEDRHHAIYSAGYEAFHQIVDRRIASFTSRDVAFAEGVLDFLIHYSGGHPRLFTRLVAESVAETDALPVPMEAARRALRPEVQILVPAVHDDWWKTLVALELSPLQKVSEEDADVQRMLEETMILEYLNGDPDEEFLDESAPWYAVHPILRDLSRFKGLVAEVRRTTVSASNGS